MAISKVNTNSIADDAVTTAKVNPAQTDITSVGTLTSATVSGDLTVDTSTLKVDSSNNRVGVGLTDPSDLFEVSNSADTPTRAIVTAEDSSGSNQNAFIKTKAKGSYYEGLEMASTSGHIGMWGGYYSGSAVLQARVGGSGINSSDVLAMVIDADGHVTKPLQPAFYAYHSSAPNNLAANTYVDILYDTERFDNNADFNPSNGTFTAPVTGKYQFNMSLRFQNAVSDHTYIYLQFNSSNSNHPIILASPGFHGDAELYVPFTGSALLDMDANDTCKVRFYQQGGTASIDVGYQYFDGHLVC